MRFDSFIQEVAMRAPSSEQEAKEIVAAMERCPRVADVNNRLQARIEASGSDEERRRWESLVLALPRDDEINEREYAEWLSLLGEEST